MMYLPLMFSSPGVPYTVRVKGRSPAACWTARAAPRMAGPCIWWPQPWPIPGRHRIRTEAPGWSSFPVFPHGPESGFQSSHTPGNGKPMASSQSVKRPLAKIHEVRFPGGQNPVRHFRQFFAYPSTQLLHGQSFLPAFHSPSALSFTGLYASLYILHSSLCTHPITRVPNGSAGPQKLGRIPSAAKSGTVST